MSLTLDSLRPGDEGSVVELTGEDEATDRLMEMGLVEGTRFKIVRYAPLGDPIEISIRGYHLTLRKAEAATVIVDRIS